MEERINGARRARQNRRQEAEKRQDRKGGYGAQDAHGSGDPMRKGRKQKHDRKRGVFQNNVKQKKQGFGKDGEVGFNGKCHN